MDGNAKSDLEHTAERTVRASTKGTGILARFITRLTIWGRKYYQKHFSSSLKALKKDGKTKELAISSPLTKEETKEIIKNAHEAGILIGIKKMQPNGEEGKNKSLHQQEKLAKNEIKFEKWNERRKVLEKIPLINKYCERKADKFRKLSIEDNKKNTEDRYIVLCNKSHLDFFNEELQKLEIKRTARNKSNDYTEIDKDGIINKDEPLEATDINISPDKLKVGVDYGSCFVKDYKNNFCHQKISKSEYCEIREQLFELKSHGAIVTPSGEVIVAINSDDLDEYKKFAPLDKPIKEYGDGGAKDIEAESNDKNIINVRIENEEDFDLFKEKYKGKDFVAIHNPEGYITACVRENDTQQLVDDVKKKSSTAELLKEANDFAEEKDTSKDVEPVIDLEEEREIDS